MRKLAIAVIAAIVGIAVFSLLFYTQQETQAQAREYTDAESDVLAQAAFSETLTEGQEAILDTIMIEDFWVLTYKVYRLRGMSHEEATALVEGAKREREENLQLSAP